MLAALWAGPARANQLTFTVPLTTARQYGTHHAVAPLQPGFVGVSLEYCVVDLYTGATADPVLTNLIADLAPDQSPVLRIGGDSTDQTHYEPGVSPPAHPPRCPYARFALTSDTIQAIAAETHALNARLILGINLKSDDLSWATSEAVALAQAVAPTSANPYIEAYELGNEPDLYTRYDSPKGFSEYLRDLARWSAAIRQATSEPGAWIAGPSLGKLGLPWINGVNAAHWRQLLHTPGYPQVVTFHAYPLISGQCPGPFCPSLGALLNDDASHGLAEDLAPFIAAVPGSREVRVDEMASVTGEGQPGISDTFASALWSLDALFEMEAAGADGVNFQTIPDTAYSLFDRVNATTWLVHPAYYGLLMFALASPPSSRLLAVRPEQAAVKVWATRSNGETRIVLINKDIHAHEVVLRGAGIARGPVTITRLTARIPAAPQRCPAAYLSTAMCATGGIALGGVSFGPQASAGHEGDYTTTGQLPPSSIAPLGSCPRFAAGQTCVIPGPALAIRLPAASAALVDDHPVGYVLQPAIRNVR
jgi:hypothetical protein